MIPLGPAVAFAVPVPVAVAATEHGVGSDLPGLRAGGPMSGWNDDN